MELKRAFSLIKEAIIEQSGPFERFFMLFFLPVLAIFFIVLAFSLEYYDYGFPIQKQETTISEHTK